MLEKTGFLATTTDKYLLRLTSEWTLALFKTEFKLGNQERIHRLTASDAGFHGAHHASVVTSAQRQPSRPPHHHQPRQFSTYLLKWQALLLLVPRPVTESESYVRHVLAQS